MRHSRPFLFQHQRIRILFDHGTPSGIPRRLVRYLVTEARELGWDRISNGDLLNVAEADRFDLLLTTDKNIRYQQNLAGRKISIVVLGNSQWPGPPFFSPMRPGGHLSRRESRARRMDLFG